jgi:hypothetical protein
MKKIGIIILGCALACILSACKTTISTTLGTDDYTYSALTFPNFGALNPVRYEAEDSMGNEYDGWQDFGPDGEIQTHPWTRMTYTYQMYSYYLRNDLMDLYQDVALPLTLAELPEWLASTTDDGHRILWFSMGRLPTTITILATQTLTANDDDQTFLRVEYEVTVDDAVESWIVYFMDAGDTFASYAVRVNELYETVRDTSDAMVKTYRPKTAATE